jgi:hypothetical protein
MNMFDRTLQEYIDLAPHYIAIGQTEVYLYRNYGGRNEGFWDKQFPWEYVTDVDSNGGAMRYNASVNIDFEAIHPCGLTFKWTLDIEPEGHAQTGYLTPDIVRLKTALSLIPSHLEEKFKASLQDFLKNVEEQTEESRQFYVKQKNKAKAFREFVEGVVEEE